jgi:hypothetical protein
MIQYLLLLSFRYIYCGKIDLTKLDGLNSLKLMTAVNELKIQNLVHSIQNYLMDNGHLISYRNSLEILDLISKNESNTDLLNF